MSTQNPQHASHPMPQTVYSPPQTPRTNGLAIATLVLGICGFAILPVVLGHIALGQIRSRHEGGAGLAVAGLVLGYLALVGYLVLAVIAIVAVAGGFAFGGR